MQQFTLSILKPDALKQNLGEKINTLIKENGLNIIASRSLHLSEQQAKAFYEVHKDRPFFNSLVKFMISGPILAQVLSGPNAISVYRKIMGNTDPLKAEPNTIRHKFAQSIEENCVHGSDSEETAAQEIPFFFAKCDLIGCI